MSPVLTVFAEALLRTRLDSQGGKQNTKNPKVSPSMHAILRTMQCLRAKKQEMQEANDTCKSNAFIKQNRKLDWLIIALPQVVILLQVKTCAAKFTIQGRGFQASVSWTYMERTSLPGQSLSA